MTVICPFFIQSTGMFGEVSPKYNLIFIIYIKNENGKIGDRYIYIYLYFFRFLPRLLPNKVADRVVTALRCNEKLVIIPGYVRFLLAAKW